MKRITTAIISLLIAPIMLPYGFAQSSEPVPEKQPTDTPAAQGDKAAVVPEERDERAGVLLKDVEIRGDQVLATVNGVKITGGDLTLFGTGYKDKPQTLSGQAYKQLLDQAIDRELILQAAKQEDVTLTDEQKKLVDGIKSDIAERVKAPWAGANLFKGTPEEQAQFEQRDAECQFLLANLMTKSGVAPPKQDVTDEQVQIYYKAHKDDFDPLPKDSKARAEAWKQIDYRIRRFYALTAIDAYSAECRKAIAEWKSKAQIEMPVPAK